MSSGSSITEPWPDDWAVATPAAAVAAATLPLPFLAPRLRRLVVDVEREYTLSSSSTSWSNTVGSSNPSISYAGSSEGARDSERQPAPGVRKLDDGCRDDGRRDCGLDSAMGKPCIELVEITRLCPKTGVSPRRVGKSLIQAPNSLASIRCESSFGSSKIQNTLLVRNSATGRVIPEKRCMKKAIGC